jgi:hypothetical protein
MDILINALLWTLVEFLASNQKFGEQPDATTMKLRVNLTSYFMITLQVSRKKTNVRLYRHNLHGQIVNFI